MNDNIKKLKNSLQPLFNHYKSKIYFAYCFGSIAYGDFSRNSDVDLAFYVHPDFNNFDFKLLLVAECSRALKRDDVDIILLNNLKNLILAEEIVRKGILLFDNSKEERTRYELDVIHRVIDFRLQRRYAMGF